VRWLGVSIFAVLVRRPGKTAIQIEENSMSATYTFDVFPSLDGYGSHKGDWGGYWGKQGPELLEHRRTSFDGEQRMVFGATTFRDFAGMLAACNEEPEVLDPWVTRMSSGCATPSAVITSTPTVAAFDQRIRVAGETRLVDSRRARREPTVQHRSGIRRGGTARHHREQGQGHRERAPENTKFPRHWAN
jgi:hypothetical protein